MVNKFKRCTLLTSLVIGFVFLEIEHSARLLFGQRLLMKEL